MLTIVDNHSVDLASLGKKTNVLDVGSRGLRFARFFAERWHRVIALDPGESEVAEGVEVYKLALVGKPSDSGDGKLILTEDREARYVIPANAETDRPYLLVKCVTLPEFMKLVGVQEFDLMKLNCEGVEFDILDNLHAPVARQIVVSFHEHCSHARRGRQAVDNLIAKLGCWYDVVRHVWDERYSAGMNAWDSVLVRREGVDSCAVSSPGPTAS